MSKKTLTLGVTDDGEELVMTTRKPIGITSSEIEDAAEAMKILYDSLICAGFSRADAIDVLANIVTKGKR